MTVGGNFAVRFVSVRRCSVPKVAVALCGAALRFVAVDVSESVCGARESSTEGRVALGQPVTAGECYRAAD